MQKELKIGFLGAGNMARSLALRLFTSEKNVKLYFYTPSKDKAKMLANDTQGIFCEKLDDFPEDLDYLFLAMKPQVFKSVQLPKLDSQTILVSILAAISLSSLKEKFQKYNVVRLMPNTPCEIGEGVFPVLAEDESLILKMGFLESFGKSITCRSESEFDSLTPLTGCMPGMMYYLMDTFKNSIDQNILKNYSDREKENMIAEVIQGSVALFLSKNKKFKTLQDEVTSKGGLTEKMIQHHELSNYDRVFKDSYQKALQRSEELNRMINNKDNENAKIN